MQETVKQLSTELPKAPGVYAIRNLQSGKCYVGSSSNISKRVSQHRSSLLQGKHHSGHLQSAWKKYGPNAFEFVVLEICQDWSKEVQFARENHWIKKLNPEYNVAPVAESSLGIKRSNETKEKMALSMELRRQKWIRSIYVKLTGSLATAVVLEQIVYWHAPDSKGNSKLRVTYQGDYWLAKPREEMMAETGVSLKQYQAAITKLKGLKIIDYRVGGFSGKPTPFIRLDATLLIQLCAGIDSDEPGCVGCTTTSLIAKEHKPLLPFDPNLCVLLPQTNTGSLTENLTTKKTASQEQSPEEEDMKGKNGLTAAQVKEMCGKKPADTSKLTSTGMYHIWAKTVPEYNESVKFVGTFTAKQKGQIGALVGKWGKEAGVVLEFILMNWVKFGKHVKEQAGLKTYPAAPTIDFLLKYANDAMSFYIARSKEEAKDESVQLIAPKPMKKLVFGKLKQAPQAEKQAAPVVEVESEDDDKPVTLEELLAMGKVYE